MSQSFTKLWIHAIWATKNRQELIDFSIEKKHAQRKHSPQFQPYRYNEFLQRSCIFRIESDAFPVVKTTGYI